MKSRSRRAESALRKHALTYPESHEDFPWGETAIKVKGKVFLFMSRDKEDVFRVTVKLPESASVALTLPFAEPTGYGLGKSGWVTSSFKPKDDVPTDMLIEWVDESFRAVAPKRVVAELGDGANADTASPPKRKGGKSRQSKSKN